MGTRADFYVGRGPNAEWLGSIGWDGFPYSIDEGVMRSSSEDEYRKRLLAWLKARDDSTFPEQGWPWPWEDSRSTDYAYAFDDGRVWIAGYACGDQWWDPKWIDYETLLEHEAMKAATQKWDREKRETGKQPRGPGGRFLARPPEPPEHEGPSAVFPNMKDKKSVPYGSARSGLIAF